MSALPRYLVGRFRPRVEPLESRVVLNAPHTGWDLTFVDEFSGTSIDRGKWATQLAWSGDDGSYRHHNSNYLSYIMDDDVVVNNGTLKLRTQRRRVYNPFGRPYDYTEGFIQTANTFSQTYGYFEIRAATRPILVESPRCCTSPARREGLLLPLAA